CMQSLEFPPVTF
nr:immunoglobulin light chain junction region [Macaca mulatta]